MAMLVVFPPCLVKKLTTGKFSEELNTLYLVDTRERMSKPVMLESFIPESLAA